MSRWIEIPVQINNDADRRAIIGILAESGLEVRVRLTRPTPKSKYVRYVDYKLPKVVE